jgi:ribulose-5-phosphate 4-epimerase/fuculose-1-phosphate aldolase
MAEERYAGTKFHTRFTRSEPPAAANVAELIPWCRRFAQLGLVGQAMGNLSLRSAHGLIITPTGTDPLTITPELLVEVMQVDIAKRELVAVGIREPSSESLLHAAIYAARPEINAIFHGHSGPLLAAADRLGIPVTAREQPYGTPALVAEVLAVARQCDFLVMRNHGFVALGKSAAQAGRRVEEVLQQL